MSPTASCTLNSKRSPYFISDFTRHLSYPDRIRRAIVKKRFIQRNHSSSPRIERSQSSQMTKVPHKCNSRMFEHISHRPTRGTELTRLIISSIREYHVSEIPLTGLMCKMSLSKRPSSVNHYFPIQFRHCHTQCDVYTGCIRLDSVTINHRLLRSALVPRDWTYTNHDSQYSTSCHTHKCQERSPNLEHPSQI
jgi:hypothetical protein